MYAAVHNSGELALCRPRDKSWSVYQVFEENENLVERVNRILFSTTGVLYALVTGNHNGRGVDADRTLKFGDEAVKLKLIYDIEEWWIDAGVDPWKNITLEELTADMKNLTMEELVTKVTELPDQKNEGSFEERARNFYAEPLDHISSKDFIEMMIVDGCFLIQLFRKCKDPTLKAFDDPVFNMDCMFHFLCRDILLLENQLPWFVIHSLYGLILDIYPGEASLSILILTALSALPSLKHSISTCTTQLVRTGKNCDADVLHILDLVRTSIVNPFNKAAKKVNGDNETAYEDTDQHQIRTATALSEADIKFKRADRESMMEIEFLKGGWFNNGTLEIPQLNVGMSSKTLFRNLIAIEQCYHGYSNEITSYAIFMDNLISSNEDMELLCEEKVIGNWMSDEDGCKFFSNLYKDIPHKNFFYVELCKNVNDRYKLKPYKWLAFTQE